MFNDKKKECDYQSENDDENKNICSNPRTFLRSKPKSSQASILFEGLDATGQFPWVATSIHFHVSHKKKSIHLEPVSTVRTKTLKSCWEILIGVIFIMFALEVEIIFSCVHREQFSTKPNKAVWIVSMELTATEHVLTSNQRWDVKNEI